MIKRIYISFMFLFLACSSAYPQTNTPPDGQEFEGFNLQGYSDSGEKSWDVKGDTANVKGTEIELSNVNANSYGEENVNVTANKGNIDQVNGNMKLQDDVVVTSKDGAKLVTDSLNWSRDNDLVNTDDDVMLVDDQITVTGTGMQAKPGLKNATINKDVTVSIDPREEKETGKVMITCDGPVEMDQLNSMAVFNNNVVAVREDQTLKADKMEIYFNAEMSNISKMVCIGNVVIEQGENQTYAEKATYDAVTKKLVLSGRPKLILLTEGENAITASGN